MESVDRKTQKVFVQDEDCFHQQGGKIGLSQRKRQEKW
jgi:hypothetical protein